MKKNVFAARMVWGVVLLLGLIAPTASGQAADGLTWFRGQLHAHSYWSDGRAFPEQMVEAYRQRGYQFLCITEHNRFGEDRDTWHEVAAEEGPWPPKATQAIFDSYRQAFGKETVDVKTEGPRTLVRLKTFAELQAQFDEPERFLLLPGVELTQTLAGRAVHVNTINLPQVLPCVQGKELIKNVEGVKSVCELIARNAAEAQQAAEARQRPYLVTLNHPFWTYYDVVPQDLLDCPAVRFFEICNGGSSFAPPQEARSYTVEKFWDVVNAFRSSRGQPLLYAVASDDAHFYDAQRINDECGVGDAWIMVHAAALTAEDLLAAMQRGDFYASTGVLLEEVAFTPAKQTLRVKVQAEPGVNYRIQFITTKRGFDPTVTEIASPAEKDRPARSVPIYSEAIGRTVQTVTGTEASYRLAAEDLYVRAQVESDHPAKIAPHFHPKTQMAWTQPYAAPGQEKPEAGKP